MNSKVLKAVISPMKNMTSILLVILFIFNQSLADTTQK